MALSPIKPTNHSNSSLSLIKESYNHTFHQSIQNLLAVLPEESLNLSHYKDVFYEQMQSKPDPPLEAIWVYSALSFRSRKIAKDDLVSRFVIVKDLFQLISGCSGLSSAHKSMALLAPVVFEVYGLVVALLGKDLSGKRVKKLVKEVKSLIGVLLGYISACCCNQMKEDSDSSFLVRFADLVRVWMDRKEGLKSFFPFVSNEIFEEFHLLHCNVNYLAGIVTTEVFLLKLCLDVRTGDRGVELEKELRSWAVMSITGFQSFFFFEILVKLMLEPSLPVTPFLSSEDELLLRTILYDAAVLVEYSFLLPESTIHLLDERVRCLAMQRLIVACEAVEFFRKAGDQKRAISYISSFSSSRLPGQIIKYVTSQIGKEDEASRLIGSSPQALIKWLLVHESEIVRLYGNHISKFCAKLATCDSKASYEQPSSSLGDNKVDVPLHNKVEEEDGDEDNKVTIESVSAAFLEAAYTMRLTENGGTKRKKRGGAGKKRIRSLMDELSDNSDSDSERSSFVSNDSSLSDS